MSVVLTLGSGNNSAAFSSVDSLTAGSGNGTIAFAGVMANASVDLGGGTDTLSLGDLGNTITVANVATITGGTSDDSVTLASALPSAVHLDFDTGNNTLTLANVANTGTVSDLDTLLGCSAADTITLGTALAGSSIDLGTGNDMLTLANGGNSLTVVNVETVTKGGISVGDDVWIGANIVLVDGATIGPGCVIGAASLLRGALPCLSIAYGVPARVVGRRGETPHGQHGQQLPRATSQRQRSRPVNQHEQ